MKQAYGHARNTNSFRMMFINIIGSLDLFTFVGSLDSNAFIGSKALKSILVLIMNYLIVKAGMFEEKQYTWYKRYSYLLEKSQYLVLNEILQSMSRI